MRNNKLGCFTGAGIVAILITLFSLVGVAFASGSQMFSAGGLNAETGQVYGGVNSHAQITECAACHPAPWSTDSMADRCANCHTDIAAQMFDVAQLHGVIMNENGTLACRDCHPEHRGAMAPLTDLGGIVFPHDALGYSLKGHQLKAMNEPFACSDCHGDDVKTFASDSCQNCHSDMDIVFAQTHLLSYGTDCLACHDGVDRFGDDFTHSAFAFNLNGKHEEVACTKCHLDARTVLDLQSVPQGCLSCHAAEDEHGGRFGQDCSDCHTSEGWKPAKFDHDLADFKLVGEHKEVACEKCHTDGSYRGTPIDCNSCHSAEDEHDGKYGKSCEVCHTPTGWEDANLDHSLFAFKLEGSHTKVLCEACHQGGVFKGTPTDCYSCHKDDDAHNGNFGTDCIICHTTPTDWKDAKFNHGGFPLTNRHAGVACERCHAGGKYFGISSACVSCHSDPAYHAGMFGTDCAACHTTSNWSAKYSGPHPSIANEGGRGVNHGGASCRTCHTSTLHSATCGNCHDGNEGGDGGGGDDD
ncbi:MAG: hypothetical protein HY863_00805 [Chloroflexi bacterium]|nr:hypothetical protein [Chloroflexota bacterium]